MNKRLRLAILALATLGMGISMPSCPGQQALQQQVDALEKHDRELTGRVKALEDQIHQMSSDMNNEVRPLLQRMGSTVLNQDKAIKDMDATLHDMAAKMAAKAKPAASAKKKRR